MQFINSKESTSNFKNMLLHFVITVTGIFFLSTINGYGIIDGWTVHKPEDFPHHVLIACVGSDGSDNWVCNGAIINNRFVALPASCAKMCNNFKIRVGSIIHPEMKNSTNDADITAYLDATEYATEYETEPGTKPYFAPGYTNLSREHDLALIETSKQIIYSKFVREVDLPHNEEATPDAVATGFGQRNKHNLLWELQYLTFKVLPKDFSLDFYSPDDTIHASSFDFGIPMLRGSLCNELGAPLVLKSDNRTLIGIYWGSRRNCPTGGPEAFVDIASHLDWIVETAKFGKLEPNIYLSTSA